MVVRGWAVRGGFLYVAQRDPGVKGGGDERMPERVGPDRLGDARAAGQAAHDSPGASGMVTTLPPFAGDHQGAVPAIDATMLTLQPACFTRCRQCPSPSALIIEDLTR
jgi:hypothetical protein